MKILVIGSGAREHAIVWKLKQSPRVKEIFAAPGNAGIKDLARCVSIAADDLEALVDFAKKEAIDLTVVGPEVPLVLGVVDVFQEAGLKIFGPNKQGAMFEGSKAYSKAFMENHHIPTAKYKEFTNLDSAKEYVDMFGFPLVIKADGLAAGKGVVICENHEDAMDTLDKMMQDKVFGDAGSKVVFEEFLTGIEASILCFVDGKTIKPMASAQDYKKAYDNDLGLNTGGMGAYSPSRLFDETLKAHVDEEILQPFMKGVLSENIDYKGIIFIGLMIEDGQAKVIEFNCRMGDPETQVVLPRMENDLLDVLEACVDGTLEDIDLKWSDKQAVGVVMASGGYPEAYEKNKLIKGLDQVDAIVFHAGTKADNDQVLTNGGRVLTVVSLNEHLSQARAHSYKELEKINFEHMMYRTDIAKSQC
ncbi:phosphoribosylamine--glycine ligase [Acidaminobacter sp. JC074]|uniref:phosphoribosylamine--glycine ligase n=1 Tax=Acidaminobacter sp. JC074 TaxID=2530199 RepID=UPI001F10939D|nr:phosphoribosylamine--glycine ligase [Acidaminobacter sp. JC074]MCH4889921.1 phosphoribosylamine--glycine ligase [Acidaminobacter sp. JC074]